MRFWKTSAATGTSGGLRARLFEGSLRGSGDRKISLSIYDSLSSG